MVLHLSVLLGLALSPTPRKSSLPPSSKLTNSPAVVRLFDEKTRSNIILVGTMHYNPHSIAVARDVVAEEAAAGRLRAVAVESCPTRWNATLESQPAGSLLRVLCDNEMQEAAETGEAAGAPVVLVDQTIEATGQRLTQLFALTVAEFLTPWKGGWNRIYDDLKQGYAQTLADENGVGVAPSVLLDPPLVAGAPLSFARYPLSIFVRAPLLGLVVALVFLAPFGIAAYDYAAMQQLSSAAQAAAAVSGGDYLAEATTAAAMPLGAAGAQLEDVTLGELVGALLFAAAEFVVLGRVLLVGLLEERNFVLARNIRKALFEKKPGTLGA